MNEIIKINYENAERPTVSGRELHETLGIETPYRIWFPRMCEYGFTENKDYTPYKFVHPQNKQETTDHMLSIGMAKELCMIQRSEIGGKIRKYFISIEEAWNTPEMVIGRALQIAKKQIDNLKTENDMLSTTVAVQEQQISELKPKASYYDVVLNCPGLLSVSVIAKDYGKSAKWLNAYLHKKGIQYKQGKTWLLYQKYAECGYTCTKTNTVPAPDGTQVPRVHTYWTQKGRLFIYDTLKSDGILPLIEYKQSA